MAYKLTHARLLEVLEYDQITGIFRWRNARAGGKVKAGDIAGTNDGAGYLRINIDYELHRNHRLAWFYVHGEWPAAQVDHIDRCRKNNAIGNLRLANTSENNQNQVSGRGSNKGGILGVYRRKDTGRWKAQIAVNGKSYSLGCFDTKEDAQAAYLAAKKEIHPFQTLVR